MFIFALSLGIFSYIVFFLGVFNLLYKSVLQTLFLFYLLWLFISFRSQLPFKIIPPIDISKYFGKYIANAKVEIVCGSLLAGLIFISFVGALGPELAFDALWYHLTFPKLYILNNAITFIPGGLLYYSAMPKLTEMLYAVMLSFGSEIYIKLFHFLFGLLSLTVLYKLSRNFFTRSVSLFVLLIFASNLVFLWELTTAYIDLSRTFYELMALWGYLLWEKEKNIRWLMISAIMIGFAITSKLLAIGSLIIFIFLLIVDYLLRRSSFMNLVQYIFIYTLLAFLVPLPWFIFSFVNTGNPVYPIFSGYDASISISLLSPINFIADFTNIFLFAADPISPIYLTVLPLLVFLYKKFPSMIKIIVWYALFAYIMWYITPRTGGGRFMLPYLPAFSIIVGGIIEYSRKYYLLNRSVILAIIFVSFLSFLYRSAATVKYIPVILGQETKQRFLSDHLNFSYGDFYDTDGYFARHMTNKDRVLLLGFHNLYYVNFPFIHGSWVKKGDRFNYIATQHAVLPERFRTWEVIYQNKKTGVMVYTKDRKFISY